jgi:hypothetical protein
LSSRLCHGLIEFQSETYLEPDNSFVSAFELSQAWGCNPVFRAMRQR